MHRLALAAAALSVAACASTPAPPAHPQDAFMAGLRGLCGNAYAGRMVTSDPADAAWVGQPLRVEVRCEGAVVRMPLALGADRSRTWLVTRTAGGVRLKHDHRHADGSPDVLTNYGGDTVDVGTAERQAFPADAESIALFRTRGNPASTANVWSLEHRPDVLAYELRRPNRRFRVEFDLTRPERLAP